MVLRELHTVLALLAGPLSARLRGALTTSWAALLGGLLEDPELPSITNNILSMISGAHQGAGGHGRVAAATGKSAGGSSVADRRKFQLQVLLTSAPQQNESL